MCARARSFLNEQGEGVYSVVVRTAAIGAATESMQSRGAELTYHQSRGGDGYTLQEAQFAPVFGMPITLLETDLAGWAILSVATSQARMRYLNWIHSYAGFFCGPPGSRSRHLGIKSPLLFPMS